jgi:gamma-glutamylcyclotransferase
MNYFAYGSNLNKKQMSARCPESKPKIGATLPNYKLIFAGYSRSLNGGTASIKPFKGQRVSGAVYEITEKDLKKLDTYEDYPSTYDHIKVTAWTDTGDPIEAVTYIKKIQSPETKPSREYLALIMQGYRDWDIE